MFLTPFLPQPQTCENTDPPTALQYWGVAVRRVKKGTAFAFADAWDMTQDFGTRYTVTAANGGLASNQPGGSAY